MMMIMTMKASRGLAAVLLAFPVFTVPGVLASPPETEIALLCRWHPPPFIRRCCSRLHLRLCLRLQRRLRLCLRLHVRQAPSCLAALRPPCQRQAPRRACTRPEPSRRACHRSKTIPISTANSSLCPFVSETYRRLVPEAAPVGRPAPNQPLRPLDARLGLEEGLEVLELAREDARRVARPVDLGGWVAFFLEELGHEPVEVR